MKEILIRLGAVLVCAAGGVFMACASSRGTWQRECADASCRQSRMIRRAHGKAKGGIRLTEGWYCYDADGNYWRSRGECD